MNKNIIIFSLIFIAFLTLFSGAPVASARTISTCTNATLKGYVSSTRDNPTTVWFEWGEGRNGNDAYPSVTGSQVLTRSGSFSEMLTGLSPDTNYFYRAIAQNRDGVTVGDLETFRTSDNCSTASTSQNQIVYREVPVIKTVYVPASSNSMTSNTKNFITTPIASSSSSSGGYSYNALQYNQQYPQYPQNSNSYSANTLSSNVSLPFNFVGFIVFLIIIMLIALVVKRILFARTR